MGVEESDDDFCEELIQPEEDVLDVCESSRTCPLPKASAPATDPPGRSNEPSGRPAGGQRSMLAWFPRAGAKTPGSSANETAKKRRDTKRQKEIEQAAASPTALTRAAHIEKSRVIRLYKDRRKAKKKGRGKGLEEEEEHNRLFGAL